MPPGLAARSGPPPAPRTEGAPTHAPKAHTRTPPKADHPSLSSAWKKSKGFAQNFFPIAQSAGTFPVNPRGATHASAGEVDEKSGRRQGSCSPCSSAGWLPIAG